MGLDTTHDCWHGAYGGFKIFREAVGKAAGLPYRKAKDGDGLVLDIDWEQVTEGQIAGQWGKQDPVGYRTPGSYDPPIRDDVLYLLIHSDCGGKLRRGYLPRLRKRLSELVPAYEKLVAETDTYRNYLEGRLRSIHRWLRCRNRGGLTCRIPVGGHSDD